jgi:alginate O-acetyltransferase complex protein AlgI
MNFVSFAFIILFSSILILFSAVRSQVGRKIIVLMASVIFYAYWDWRFLGLLALVTLLDYFISRGLISAEDPRSRRRLLLLSLVVNLGVLAIFKYFNFFTDSFNLMLSRTRWQIPMVHIILPIGISFYTFETLSYVIDVYLKNTRPAKSLFDYAVFITFFPRLVAGPITRAWQFLPQLDTGFIVSTEGLAEGSQLFLRGIVKKLVLADRLSLLVDQVYATPTLFSSSTVWLAVFGYSFQIFLDFSGYSDMAVGLAKMIGISLPKNFDSPYAAQSFSEFWRRWHISLSSWLRDYLYIPLGGNQKGPARTYFNLMVTMLLGGLWHGANWNFVIWGGLHGIYLALERALRSGRAPSSDSKETWIWWKALATFLVVTLTWVIFRSSSLAQAGMIFQKLFSLNKEGIQWIYGPAILLIPILLLGEFFMRATRRDGPTFSLKQPSFFAAMLVQVLLIYFFAPASVSPFIYFQF